jgi:hypothetical protein
MTKPVRLELNNTGAWKLIGRFDAANDDQADRIMAAADKLAFALNAPGLARTDLRVSTDESLPAVLMRWSPKRCIWLCTGPLADMGVE